MTDLAKFAAQGDTLTLPDGARVFAPGDESSAFFIVTKGAVRVEQTNSAGRTVVLYRVAAGESCVLTTACLLSGRTYAGYGYAEGTVTAQALSPAVFRRLMQTDPAFQQGVFESFALRVGELTGVIDDLLEHRTDMRLARWLAAAPTETIEMTQSDIAQELGTAREVVSRTLHTFESKGWVTLTRGKIIVDKQDQLRAYGAPTV